MEKEYKCVVVLSAMSSLKKSEGTTSRLLKAAQEVLVPGSQLYLDLVASLEDDHIKTAQECLNQPPEPEANTKVEDATIGDRLMEDLKVEFTRLRNFMCAAEIIDEMSPRSKDVIVGTGEKLSCHIFSALLNHTGLNSRFVALDRVVDHHNHNAAVDLDQRFYDELSVSVAEHVIGRNSSINIEEDNVDFSIPVVTGFMGLIPGGLLNAVGRGYSDFTAALISAGLRRLNHPIAELQIWKEVDGIFTADPKAVSTARLLTSIYPDEVAELTYYGSEVIHPFTMEQVIRARIPIRIKNTFKPDQCGTVILPDESIENEDIENNNDMADETHNGEMLATAVTLKTDVCCLNIHSNRKSVSHGFLANIFTTLDKYGIVADLISTSEVHVSMALSNTSNQLHSNSSSSINIPNSLTGSNGNNGNSKLDRLMKDLEPLGDISVIQGMSILSLVGRQMKNMVGIAGKMFTALSTENVNIEMISQGASEINISCVIRELDSQRALEYVHNTCVLGTTVDK